MQTKTNNAPSEQKAYYHSVPVVILTAFSECSLIRCLLNDLSFVVYNTDIEFRLAKGGA